VLPVCGFLVAGLIAERNLAPLGVVLARMNDPAGAKAELERAIALGDDSQEAQDDLARVKQVVGSQ